MPEILIPKVESVGVVVSNIKNWLESNYRECLVEGEITNLSHSSAGHSYFTLSDENAVLSAAIFKMDVMRNSITKTLKNGDKIICLGTLTIYPKRGSFQIVVKKIFPSGIGQLVLNFEILKKKLAEEGLFDPKRKKEIPKFPKRVALITALGGAALHDFINVYKRKSIWMDILIVPALVQGADAPNSLIKALENCEKLEGIDTIVLARGGGSLEDLWAFNNEQLARVIARVKPPVISAIGHQVDFTICDFVADLRAETPTAAAEILTQHQSELKLRFAPIPQRLNNFIKMKMVHLNAQLNMLTPEIYLKNLWKRLIIYQKKMNSLNILSRSYELIGVHEYQSKLDSLIQRLLVRIDKNIEIKKTKLNNLGNMLDVLNPSEVLSRGYTYLTDQRNKMITDKKTYQQLPNNYKFIIKFKDGDGIARVEQEN